MQNNSDGNVKEPLSEAELLAVVLRNRPVMANAYYTGKKVFERTEGRAWLTPLGWVFQMVQTRTSIDTIFHVRQSNLRLFNI